MSNLVTVNSGSAINGTLKAGRIAISTDTSITASAGWYSMINPAGGYSFITDGKIQNYSDAPLIYPTQTSLPADILATINGLPDRVGSIPFDNVWDALVWVQSTGKYFILDKTPTKYPSDGLKFYFDASEISSYPKSGSIAYDLALTNEGDFTNGPVFDETNDSIYFDGTNDHIDFGDVNDLDFGADSFTVAAIAYMDSADATIDYRNIVSKKVGGGVQSGWVLRRNSNDLLTFFPADGTYREDASEGSASPFDRWLFVMGWFDREAGVSRLYVGNEQKGSNAINGSFNSVSSTATFQIGTWNGNTDYYKGNIAKVWAYNKSLSTEELNHLYFGTPIVTDGLKFALDAGNLVSYDKNGTTMYSLTGSLSGSLNNGVSYTDSYGGSFEFDGTDDYISTEPFDMGTPTDITLECWIKFNGTLDSNDRKVMHYDKTGTTNAVFQLRKGTTNSQLMYQAHNGSQWYTMTDADAIEANTWAHFTITHAGTSAIMYKNGVQSATATMGNLDWTNANNLLVGYRAASEYWKGNIAIMRIYNRALSATEVKQNYNAEYSKYVSSRDITKDGLVLHLDAHDPNSYLSGNTWTDLSGNGFDASLVNGPAYTDNGGGALYFDRTDDIGNLGYHAELLPNDITQEAWVKARNFENWHGIITNMSGWGTGFSLQIGTTQNIAAMVSGAYLKTSWTPQTNFWYHIVATHRSSDNLNVLYVNGVQENSSTRAISYNSNQVTDIGCFYTGGSLRLDGEIAVIRTYNRALSAQEVLNNYLAQAPRFATTKKISPLDYSLKLNLDAGDITSYPRTGTTWYDRSGNGNNATLYNSPTYTIAEGGVFDLDGTDDYFIAPASAAGMYNFGTDGTLEMWFRPDASFTTNHRLMCVTNNASAIDIYIASSGTLYLHGNKAYASSNTIPINEWTHLMVTYIGGTVQIYFNGEAQTMAGTQLTGYNITNNNQLFIGQFSGGGSYYFNGKIANAKIYHRGLTPSEVLENYKSTRSRFDTEGIVTSDLDLSVDFGNVDSYDNSSTTINDLSGNNNNGTLVNGPVFNPEVGGNASFDDTDDYITFGNPSITQYTYATDFSLEVWINPDTVSGFKHLIGKSYGNYRLAQNGTGVSFRLDTNVLTTQSGTLVIGKWTHIVATYEASTKTARVYQDGVLVTTSSNSNLDWTSGSGNFQLGNSPGENYYFGGKIALGRAYGKKLTDAEVLQNYNAERNRFGKD